MIYFCRKILKSKIMRFGKQRPPCDVIVTKDDLEAFDSTVQGYRVYQFLSEYYK